MVKFKRYIVAACACVSMCVWHVLFKKYIFWHISTHDWYHKSRLRLNDDKFDLDRCWKHYIYIRPISSITYYCQTNHNFLCVTAYIKNDNTKPKNTKPFSIFVGRFLLLLLLFCAKSWCTLNNNINI